MYSNKLHYPGLRLDDSVSAAIENTPKLSPELESALILRAQQGDYEARQQIILANLAWISAVGGTSSGRGLEDDELLSAGILGLNEAIDRWSPEQQSNIRTYGQFWIRKFQKESLFQVDTIRIPKSAHEQIAKLRKARRVLGDEATISELAEYTQLQEKRIIELQSISQPSSLNACIGAEGKTELLELQADQSCECSDLPFSPELQHLIEHLNPRQKEVIHLRFFEGWTFKKIGEYFSLTSQRIRQICKSALEKLREWLVGGRDEPIVESIPAPQRWQQYVFTKVMLATEFCRRSLKPKPQHRFKNFLTVLIQPRPIDQEPILEHESSLKEAIHPEIQTAILNHHIDSGGLRDGPKSVVDACWHGVNSITQFLGNWTGVPRGCEQYRCRGETEVLYQKKKVRPKVFSAIQLAQFCPFVNIKSQDKIEYSNSIIPFARNSIVLV